MIVIYINSEGTAQKVSPSHVYQGSNQSGVLVFAPVPTTTALAIAFKLPDGTNSPYYPMTFIQTVDGLTQYEFKIGSSLTQEAGQASIALQAVFTDGQQTSQFVPFEIEPSVLPSLPDEIDEDAYTLIMQYLQQDRTDITAIQGQIDEFEATADSAEKASAEAVETANAAKETADGLADSIAQANANASQAVDTANKAETTANGLADSIAQANETAENAVNTANSAVEDIEEYKNQINSDVEGLREDINKSQFFKGMFNTVEELKEAYPTATENDYAYVIGGNQWIYTDGEWTDSGEPTPNTAVPRSTSIPLMDGEGSAGTQGAYASGDHRHPSDTNKVNKSGDTMTGNLVIQNMNSNWCSVRVQNKNGTSIILEKATDDAYLVVRDANGNNQAYISFPLTGTSRKTFAIAENTLQVDSTKLEPSTANGWTVGGNNLAIMEPGIYLIAATTTSNISNATPVLAVVERKEVTSDIYSISASGCYVSVSSGIQGVFAYGSYYTSTNAQFTVPYWRVYSNSTSYTNAVSTAYKKLA